MKMIIIMLVCFVTISPVITGTDEGRFAIFLPLKEIPFKKKYDLDIDLKKLKIRRFPIIDERDLISYSLKTHTMKLTSEAWKKIMNLKIHTVFIVCVGKEPIYWGIIWSSGSSISFPGIIIDQHKELILLNSLKPVDYWFRIECGYPSEKFFLGIDLRSDDRIINALRASGKLIE